VLITDLAEGWPLAFENTGSALQLRVWKGTELGCLRTRDLLPLLSAETRLVLLPLVSPVSGALLDWQKTHDLIRHYAPGAIIVLDVTQAWARMQLQGMDLADGVMAAGHGWALGIHGGAVLGISSLARDRWLRLGVDWAAPRAGLPVGVEGISAGHDPMTVLSGLPIPACYALHAGLNYIQNIGLEAVQQEADALVSYALNHLKTLGLQPLGRRSQEVGSGIVAWDHPMAAQLHQALRERGVEVVRAGNRLRASLHGYNTTHDINRMLTVLDKTLP
jgi:cysteine desulfurase / selenocysteine lyase